MTIGRSVLGVRFIPAFVALVPLSFAGVGGPLKLGMFFKQLNGGNIFLAASAPRVREGVLGVKANVYAAARTRKKEIEKTHTHTRCPSALESVASVLHLVYGSIADGEEE